MGGGKQNTAFCQWKEGGRLKRRVDLWVVIYGMYALIEKLTFKKMNPEEIIPSSWD